ncbi:MAG TPA: site-2 protease family protein [Candidatus Peregrinibacteria bacterium]|nr:site-2 protease family protein [Candidatus Peregrinibacteria bacterium]
MSSLNIYFIVALLVAITVHEFAHAWTATYLGDPTAQYQGRISLNPLRHLDPLGTLMLFIAGFGWGKPVPFNPRNLKNPHRDSALIALAGPLANLIIILVFAIPYRYLFGHLSILTLENSFSFTFFFFRLIQAIISLNLILMIFNLLPFPPLDGAKIFSIFIPSRYLSKLATYERYGYFLLLIILLSDRLLGIPILTYILVPIIDFSWSLILFST